MYNKTEKEEKQYLESLIRKVELAIQLINERIRSQSDEVKYLNTHLQEYKTDMDHLEKNAMREAITNTTSLGDHSVETKKRLLRLREIPYFGRIDFTEKQKTSPEPIYIGVHNFRDGDRRTNLVHDWRAPVSGMFYDFEPGEAFYETPQGIIEGAIGFKRQYRIRNGEMEFMLDSDITIQDDVLQRELNRSSSNCLPALQVQGNHLLGRYPDHFPQQGVCQLYFECASRTG